jgi:hypothetical protein
VVACLVAMVGVLQELPEWLHVLVAVVLLVFQTHPLLFRFKAALELRGRGAARREVLEYWVLVALLR